MVFSWVSGNWHWSVRYLAKVSGNWQVGLMWLLINIFIILWLVLHVPIPAQCHMEGCIWTLYWCRVFFLRGDWGGPPIRRKICQSPPSDTCPHFWTKAGPPQPRFVPENLKNLNTFLCQIWLHAKNSKKWPNFALSGQLWLQSDFFASPPPHPTSSPSVPDGDRKFWVPPHQKFREKALWRCLIGKISVVFKIFTKNP